MIQHDDDFQVHSPIGSFGPFGNDLNWSKDVADWDEAGREIEGFLKQVTVVDLPGNTHALEMEEYINEVLELCRNNQYPCLRRGGNRVLEVWASEQ